ncbi:MAG: hypothetical protein AB7E77_05210 [Desulfobulbus sp.]
MYNLMDRLTQPLLIKRAFKPENSATVTNPVTPFNDGLLILCQFVGYKVHYILQKQ